MRWFFGAAALSVMLATAPTFAHPPAPPASADQGAPAGQAPAQPAPPPSPVAQPAIPRPFPEGVKYGFVNVQRIANESTEGKAATSQVQALNNKKVEELNARNKQLQASQQKLESGGSVMSPQALAQLQKDIERQQVDIQRFTEDAQQEVTQLQQQLQDEFQRKLTPVIAQVASERQLHMMFSVVDSGLVWGDPALDLTPEIIKRFDAAGPARPAAAAPQSKPAAPPAAPAPAPKPIVPPPATPGK
ncbi:MAG TPA: OmpH family outer membrane protein [Vicinamibacterales bacterium]